MKEPGRQERARESGGRTHNTRVDTVSAGRHMRSEEKTAGIPLTIHEMQLLHGNRYVQGFFKDIGNEPKCMEFCGTKAIYMKASGACSGGCQCRKSDEEEANRMELYIQKSESLTQTKTDACERPALNESGMVGQIMSQKGGGTPLNRDAGKYMSSRFGYDFSHVRIHTDSFASRAADYMNAEAFTVGRDVFFNTGRYNHSTLQGKKLLAHELAHVVQQAGGRPRINCWTKSGVIGELCPSADKWVVGKLDKSKVYSFDKIIRRWKIYEKTSTGGKGKFLKNHAYEVDGLASPVDKEIWVRSGETDKEAAATFYHEITHQGQPATMAMLDKEYDAWIQTEGYRIRHGLPETAPGFRKKKGAAWVANEPEIKKYVKAAYQHRDPSSPYIYEWDRQDTYNKKQVTGWVCP